MAKHIAELVTMQDAVTYWRTCLIDFADKDDERVAGTMVNLAGNDHFDHWYRPEEGGDILFTELFDIVVELDRPVSLTVAGTRAASWERVHRLLEALETKYLAKG